MRWSLGAARRVPFAEIAPRSYRVRGDVMRFAGIVSAQSLAAGRLGGSGIVVDVEEPVSSTSCGPESIQLRT